MRVWTIWGTPTSSSGVIHFDDRSFESFYNWLLDSSSGLRTTYASISKEDSTVTLTVL